MDTKMMEAELEEMVKHLDGLEDDNVPKKKARQE